VRQPWQSPPLWGLHLNGKAVDVINAGVMGQFARMGRVMLRSAPSEMWRAECDAINQEMERLILSPWPRSQEENQVRKIQFAALIERRNEAARHFLAGAAVDRRFGSAPEPTGPGQE
jgi:hypothetical protein